MPTDRTEPVIDDTRASAVKPESRALVALARVERRARRRWYRWSPDPVFVTHLIASDQQVPQARRVRRASLADANAAYRPVQPPAADVGSRTRQVI